jgi:hypothetical protein
MEEDLIRFPCEECGKSLGADPEMRFVVCPKCALKKIVPSREAARAFQSQLVLMSREHERRERPEGTHNLVRLVSVDLSFVNLLKLGAKVAVAAIPLVLVVAAAACGVIWVAKVIWTSPE